MKTLKLILVSLMLFFFTSCTTFYRKPTVENVKMTEVGSRIASKAENIEKKSKVTEQFAKVGAKETSEANSKDKFVTIATIQKDSIQPDAEEIQELGQLIIDKNKGEIKISFTYKLLGWLILFLTIGGILSYFGVMPFVRKALTAVLSPATRALEEIGEHVMTSNKMVNDVADTVAKQALYSPIENSKFPRGIRERMVNREEVPNPAATIESVVKKETT